MYIVHCWMLYAYICSLRYEIKSDKKLNSNSFSIDPSKLNMAMLNVEKLIDE
jgi:hypothetical protein